MLHDSLSAKPRCFFARRRLLLRVPLAGLHVASSKVRRLVDTAWEHGTWSMERKEHHTFKTDWRRLLFHALCAGALPGVGVVELLRTVVAAVSAATVGRSVPACLPRTQE